MRVIDLSSQIAEQIHMNKGYACQELTHRKKVLFTLLTLFVVWLISDTIAYVTLRYLRETKNVFITIRPATSDEQVWRWYERSPFHARWGWDIPEDRKGKFGNRKGREYGIRYRYAIKVFGDSFAYGAGVKDSETFEYLIEEKTGWDFLNYGVTGFGTDQALLKYADNGIKTRYTVLSILDENIERILDNCRGLLDPRQAKKPKPRFWIRPDGSITLLENPLKSPSDLHKLKDISFLESLKEHQYWSKYYEKLHAPSELRWPATLTIIPHFDYFLGTVARQAGHAAWPTYESHVSRLPYNHLYEEGSEGLKIMRHIIKQFGATAAARDEIPVIVVFPKREALKIIRKYGKKPYQSMVDFLKAEGHGFIDFGDVFTDKDISKYYIADGHYSLAGNEVIANELIRFIQRLNG